MVFRIKLSPIVFLQSVEQLSKHEEKSELHITNTHALIVHTIELHRAGKLHRPLIFLWDLDEVRILTI